MAISRNKIQEGDEGDEGFDTKSKQHSRSSVINTFIMRLQVPTWVAQHEI
jgi:hypothetical protein